MPSHFPAGYDNLGSNNPTSTSPRNNPSLAGEIVNGNDAVDAIQTTLGLNPQGAFATVLARLQNIETELANTGGDAHITGQVIWGVWSAAPAGYLLCDGSYVLRSAYPDLFAVCLTKFNLPGDSDGSRFRLPSLRGRSVVAPDNMGTGTGAANLLPSASYPWSSTIGGAGGEAAHVQIASEIAQHVHDLNNHTHGLNSHTHGINHDHPSFNLADHHHGAGAGLQFIIGLGNETKSVIASASSSNGVTFTTQTTDASLSVNMPSFTGTSGQATGNTSAANGSTSTTPATATAGANVVQPTVVLNAAVAI